MCVAAIAWDAHPDWLLVAAGNRDEFHARPASPLARWDDASGIIAGTDLTGGGTWLGVSEEGRFALVTNYRVPEGSQPGRPSRGKLVTDLLHGRGGGDVAAMNPFNLVHCSTDRAWFMTNHPRPEHRPLTQGIHGLSNGGFDVPWPKTRDVEDALGAWLDAGAVPIPRRNEALFARLRCEDASLAPENGDAPEPRFAPVFIRDAVYGTRCSTIVAVDRAGRGQALERRFDETGDCIGQERVAFRWPIG